MRKKYLSALLFGALLVTSAGTFTSCKDYDDEINNLQGQIDEIKTTLSELEEQIGATGVSSVTFDEATGMLTVVDASGSKSYKIQTSAEAKVDATISEDGILTINGKEIGKVRDGGDTVTVEGDKLIVNDEVVATLPSGNFVTMFKDEANKTVTLVSGDETVTLPYGADAGVIAQISLGATANFANINWATAAAANADWKGPKGPIKADQFMVGYIAPIEVKVSPYTYDLQAQDIKLVNTLGETAPVNVIATPTVTAEADKPATGTSRAASVNGVWNLTVSMKEDVTAETIADTFMSEDKHVLYALQINGNVVSPYGIEIQVNEKATESDDKPADGKKVVCRGENILSLAPGDKYEFEYTDPAAYDSYITFEGGSGDLAKSLQIEADGMTITIPATVPAATKLTATIHVMNVDGTELKTGTFEIATQSTQVAPVEGLKSTYKLTQKQADAQKITLDVTGVFGYSDIELLSNPKNYNMEVVSDNVKNFFYYVPNTATESNPSNSNNGVLEVTGVALKKVGTNGKLTTWSPADAISDLTAIEFTVNNNDASATGTDTEVAAAKAEYNKDSKAGAYEVEVTLTNGANEVRKFTNELTVSMPTMDEFLTKTSLWADADNLTMQLDDEGQVPSMYTAYSLVDGAIKENVSFRFGTYLYFANAANATSETYSEGPLVQLVSEKIVEGPVNNDGYHTYRIVKNTGVNEIKLAACAVWALDEDNVRDADKDGTLRSASVTTVYNLNGYELTDNFTMHFNNVLEGAKIVYLKPVEQADESYKWVESAIEMAPSASQTVSFITAESEGEVPAASASSTAGLAISYKGKYYCISSSTYDSPEINDETIDFSSENNSSHWSFELNKEVVGEEAGVKWYDGVLTFSNLPENGIYNIVVTPTYKKAGQVGYNPSDVHFTLPSITISVK